MGFLHTTASYVLAGLCASFALVFAVAQIVSHLRTYTGPIFQRYIVRIIFMVPVYSVASFLSLMMPHNSIYFDTVRDCYEAWVIYNFLSLCLAYVGGPGAVEVKMNGYTLMPSCSYWTCCLPPLPVNGRFVRHCKQGALQFVILKPVLAALTLALYSKSKYQEGNWGVENGYLWIQIIYNICYSVALYALLLFYLGTHDLLAPFNPLLKFILVKAVIFLTFWQSLLVSILVGCGVINDEIDGKELQNLLICLEMLPASIFMVFAFPSSEYKGNAPKSGMGIDNVRHAISIHDVVSDTVHQFAPTYHEYVLYSNGAGKGAPKKSTAQPKPFVTAGRENGGRDSKDVDAYSDGANLLENAEMGIHARNTTMSDRDALGTSTFQDDLLFSSSTQEGESSGRSPYLRPQRSLDEIEDGIELSSGAVVQKVVPGKLVRMDTTDDMYADNGLEQDSPSPSGSSGTRL